MVYHSLLILLQFLLIHSIEIDITKKQKKQLAIFDYSTIENKTGSLSFNSYKIRESTILQSDYGKFPVMLIPGIYTVEFDGIEKADRIQYELIDNPVFLFKSGLTKKCFGRNPMETPLESIEFNLESDTIVTVMYQLSAETNQRIKPINNLLVISLVIDNIAIYSESGCASTYQSNYHHQLLLKKGLHNIQLIANANAQTDIHKNLGAWCSNPELDNGFKHGRYLAVYYPPKLKEKVKVNKINIKEPLEIIIPELFYSFPYITS